MGAVANLMSASTTASSTFSKYNATTSQTQFQVNQDNTNAALANIQAQQSTVEGNQKSSVAGLETGAEVGKAVAGYASQGVVVGAGSAGAVVNSLQQKGAQTQQQIQSSAWRQSFGFSVESSQYASKAQFDQIEGDENANQTLLTGGMQSLTDITKAFSPKVA